MAQFDVFHNRGKNQKVIPYFVQVQTKGLDASARRVVIPLVRASEFGRIDLKRFNPTFSIHGNDVVLQPLEIVSVPAPPSDDFVLSLADQGDEIIAAIDELISRGYG